MWIQNGNFVQDVSNFLKKAWTKQGVFIPFSNFLRSLVRIHNAIVLQFEMQTSQRILCLELKIERRKRETPSRALSGSLYNRGFTVFI